MTYQTYNVLEIRQALHQCDPEGGWVEPTKGFPPFAFLISDEDVIAACGFVSVPGIGIVSSIDATKIVRIVKFQSLAIPFYKVVCLSFIFVFFGLIWSNSMKMDAILTGLTPSGDIQQPVLTGHLAILCPALILLTVIAFYYWLVVRKLDIKLIEAISEPQKKAFFDQSGWGDPDKLENKND